MLSEELKKLIEENYPDNIRIFRLFYKYNEKFIECVKNWNTITDVDLQYNILDFTVQQNKEKEEKLLMMEFEFQKRITYNEAQYKRRNNCK